MIGQFEFFKATGMEWLDKLIILRGCRGNLIYLKGYRVFSILYTMDNKFVISGSDDTNIRVWKARASQQLR